MTISIDKEEISIVCQGLLDENSLILDPTVISNYFNSVDKIIVSFWNTKESKTGEVFDKVLSAQQVWGNKITFINNNMTPVEEIKHQEIAMRANLYNQMSSTLFGLRECNTKYCIKVRTDEAYENLQPLVDKFCSFKNKDLNSKAIVSGNMFYRAQKYSWKHAYHISDHLFMSETENLLLAFENLCNLIKGDNTSKLDTYIEQFSNKNMGAEKSIGFSFLISNDLVDSIDQMNSEIKDLTIKHFDFVDVNDLGNYICKWNSAGRTYSNILPNCQPIATTNKKNI